MLPEPHVYVFPHCTLPALSEGQLTGPDLPPLADHRYLALEPTALTIDAGTFAPPADPFPAVTVTQGPAGLTVSCSCPAPRARLCAHQALTLRALLLRPALRVFFDAGLRQQKLRAAALPYGLEDEADLAACFTLRYAAGQLTIAPTQAGLLALTAAAQHTLAAALLPPPPAPGPAGVRVLVLGPHKYYDHLTAHLFTAALTAAGRPKNPLTGLAPLEAALAGAALAEARFFAGVARLQHPHGERGPEADQEALRAVVANPLALPVFLSTTPLTEKAAAKSLVPLTLRTARVEVPVTVRARGAYYEVSAQVVLNGTAHDPRTLPLRYGSFLVLDNSWYLVEAAGVRRIIDFFKSHNNALVLHESQFAAFQQTILARLGPGVPVHYPDLPAAPPAQLRRNDLAQPPAKLLYLSDSGDYVELLPVVRYGPVEVPALTGQAVYARDAATGRPFAVPRDWAVEDAFTALLRRQHPDFEEQTGREAFSLSRRQFQHDDWFLGAYAAWEQHGVTVLGFRELKDNRFNPHQARITVRVGTEANWFDTELYAHFGPQRVGAARLHQALRKHSRYVPLDDGTLGILPQAWLDRFARYFAAGVLVDDGIRTPKVNFAALEADYEPEFLTAETRAELARYQALARDFAGIAAVAPPAELRGTLRPYQQHGLNWLCFLDTFNFGGCLADDMGLGKTITVLALLLLQRTRRPGAVSLVVVPTSLVFNWQVEAARFAPTLRLLVLHGPDRPRTAAAFAGVDVVLTTYGTLLTDVAWLRHYAFNYAVLDEAQAIKNPASQRYHAARQLQARNRLVLTGTPIENSTYDLYGQLSFACPGLLGSQPHFRDQFAQPIDKFKSAPHARALLRKIRPFVLRRTKQQVAAELPAKTEMVLLCPMDEEQRRVYEFYKKEYRAWLMGRDYTHLPTQRLHILQGLTKLRQICNSPALLRDDVAYGAASAKLHRLVHEIEDKAPEHKILVFSQFVGMLDLIRPALQARGIGTAMLTGRTKNRAAAVAAFREDAAVRVFLISLKAGGTGLNLTEADYVYLVDPWWNPAVENQAIDRSHRPGQHRPVVAVRLICPDTIEEKIQDLQAGKQALATDLIRTDTAILKSLSAAELLGLFQ